MNKHLTDLNAAVEKALKLSDSETADAVIGEQTEEYRTLLWALAKFFGVKENKQSLKGFAQAMMVVLTLVHYAYALGIKRGQAQ